MQRRRRLFQFGFFALFLSAPSLNLLRFDLYETQLWLMGRPWSLGIDAFRSGQISAEHVAVDIFVRGLLPVVGLAVAFLAVAWRFGRLYCGWLCPHFSLVEMLNGLLQRACGKLSLWERRATPPAGLRTDARWWPVFVVACAGFGFLWALTLLTYLLPPAVIWGNLLHGRLTGNQARFIVIGGLAFTAELVLARHLFCRFGCAVGLFQSLVWMTNPRGMVVAFDRSRARDCRDCTTAASPDGNACDNGCPMRLRPRNIKRLMFSCVQCGRCLQSCDQSQLARGRTPLLEWKLDAEALRETLKQNQRKAVHAKPHAKPQATPKRPGPSVEA